MKRLALVFTLLTASMLVVSSKATAAAPGGCTLVSLPQGGATAVPSAEFDPVHASDAQLASCGFPQRPRDPRALAQWNELMSHAKHYVFPRGGSASGPISDAGLAYTNYGNHEAGYQVVTNQPSGADYFYLAEQQWTQPSMYFTTAGQLYAIWDAINDAAFPQAGTVQFQGGSGPQFFWTDACRSGNAQTGGLPPMSAGDTVYTSTEVGSYGGIYDEKFYYEDLTRSSVTTTYEYCGDDTAAGPAQFALEVNKPLLPTGWGSFCNFPEQNSWVGGTTGSGYLDTFNYKWYILTSAGTTSGTTVAIPTLPTSNGDYTMQYGASSPPPPSPCA